MVVHRTIDIPAEPKSHAAWPRARGQCPTLGRAIKRVRDVYWLDELGIAQAVWVLEVERFGPFLVESDAAGNSLFERNNREINRHLDRLYEGLGRPALGRLGEVDRPTDELI